MKSLTKILEEVGKKESELSSLKEENNLLKEDLDF
jgi:cell shape-determining protein MreC